MDPIYEYVRGEGWVPVANHRDVQSYDKVWFRIEKRKPNPGELFRYTNANWDIEQWVNWLKDTRSEYAGLESDKFQHIVTGDYSMITITRLG